MIWQLSVYFLSLFIDAIEHVAANLDNLTDSAVWNTRETGARETGDIFWQSLVKTSYKLQVNNFSL